MPEFRLLKPIALPDMAGFMDWVPAGSMCKRGFGQRLQDFIRRRVYRIAIPRSAWVARTALVDRTYPQGIHIGEDCVIDHEAVVLAHDRTRGMFVDTWIGARTYIGPRAIVMPGVRVGEDCVIEAGACVIRDVQAGSRVRGNPGKVVGPDKVIEN